MTKDIEEEIVAVLSSPEEYAYHINQVASLSTENIRVLRKQLSLKAPYFIENVPLKNCTSIEYKHGLVPFRIIAGILLTSLLLGIFYYLIVYWSSLESGTTIKVGLLALAFSYGLKWAFMSRRHNLVFHLHDSSVLSWQSRSGDFKYKQRVVGNIIEYLETQGVTVTLLPHLTRHSSGTPDGAP